MRTNRIVRLPAAARLLCLLFLLPALAGAQAPASSGKSFLWEVRSDRSRVFLLGSIHFLRGEDYPLQQTIEESFARAKKVVLEIELDGAAPERIQQLTLEKGLFRNGKTLRQSVAPETYELARSRAKELGVDVETLEPFKPWVVALTLASLKLKKLGYDPSLGVDRYLARRAKEANKPLAGLETAEFQIALFDGFSAREQEQMLLQTLREMDLLDKSVERIVQSWRTGDAAALADLMLASMRQYPEVHRKLIEDRNRRWVPQIERLLAEGDDALVVVGAAHLVGEAGVLELLRARGYRVEQK
ncbi:MAG TPA: TraB/GumN family protein [candidate division Zixibacteria bacterium]|nr:TraB/GumN family protein [candidate division Zixibacteria bacterium]